MKMILVDQLDTGLVYCHDQLDTGLVYCHFPGVRVNWWFSNNVLKETNDHCWSEIFLMLEACPSTLLTVSVLKATFVDLLLSPTVSQCCHA